MKVLVIDDDEAIISIWTTVLKKDAFEVLTAGTGKLGIELAQKNLPDFILLDQIIPDMKGNDVLKQIKANPTTAQIPVALVSNYSEPEMMHEAINNGAIDYILKYQIDPQDLGNKIKTLLHGTKPLNPEAEQPAPAPSAAPADPQSQIPTNPTDPTATPPTTPPGTDPNTNN
jgi:DNA-binding response OmpR family regulator